MARDWPPILGFKLLERLLSYFLTVLLSYCLTFLLSYLLTVLHILPRVETHGQRLVAHTGL